MKIENEIKKTIYLNSTPLKKYLAKFLIQRNVR